MLKKLVGGGLLNLSGFHELLLLLLTGMHELLEHSGLGGDGFRNHSFEFGDIVLMSLV